jgi:acyl-CoA thioesterase-1
LAGKFRQYGASLLLVHLAIACSPSAPPPGNETAPNAAAGNATVAADARLVVVFGDSLYAGYSLADGEGFAPVLQADLKVRGVAAQVVNAGVSGDTSAEGLARLGFVLDGLARKPDLVVVGLGGNDMLRGLDPAATRSNLDAILAELKKRGIPAMLTGMLAAPNMGPEYAGRFNAIYPDLAAKYDVPLYPFFLQDVLGNRALMLQDGIHPNADGVKIVSGHVAPMVAERLSN